MKRMDISLPCKGTREAQKQRGQHSLEQPKHQRVIAHKNYESLQHFRALPLSNHHTKWKHLTDGKTSLAHKTDNTVPKWLLPCAYTTPPCTCNALLSPNILLIEGIQTRKLPPTILLNHK